MNELAIFACRLWRLRWIRRTLFVSLIATYPSNANYKCLYFLDLMVDMASDILATVMAVSMAVCFDSLKLAVHLARRSRFCLFCITRFWLWRLWTRRRLRTRRLRTRRRLRLRSRLRIRIWRSLQVTTCSGRAAFQRHTLDISSNLQPFYFCA